MPLVSAAAGASCPALRLRAREYLGEVALVDKSAHGRRLAASGAALSNCLHIDPARNSHW